jgi:hypothetical protein
MKVVVVVVAVVVVVVVVSAAICHTLCIMMCKTFILEMKTLNELLKSWES